MAKYNVSVVVIDNDETDKIQQIVADFAATYPLPLTYVHAPSRNISVARNAALDAVETRWLLFIDDDEIADPRWLQNIMAGSSNADFVIGQCIATYDPALAEWVKKCDFHSNRIAGKVKNAYTGNALLNIDFIRSKGLRFRLELGKTGGEDTVFFREAHDSGGRIEYCADAIVFEAVPPSRATMQWVKTRMYRAGQTHGLVAREFEVKSFSTLGFAAGAKALFSGLMALLTIPGTVRSRKWIARAYLHAGAVHYWLKPEILEEYA